ncbi:MAG: hypothetical protein CM15mP127_12480 [Gammaproteobacteria bacterium]|nr:MAG: hypothetical protein CM15mP127_12480 [Gammaproteobacteria bacterium]
MSDILKIGERSFSSRLMLGTGKYKDFQETKDAISASGVEIVTVAIRRTNLGQNSNEPNLLDFIDPENGQYCRIQQDVSLQMMLLGLVSYRENYLMVKHL